MPSKPFLCNFIDKIESIETSDPLGDLLANRSVMHGDLLNDKKVLLLSNDYDPEANLIGIGLRNRGIDYVRLNTNDIPRLIRVCYAIDQNSDLKFEAVVRNHFLDISKVSVIVLRNFEIRDINFKGDALFSEFSLQQWGNTFQTLNNYSPSEWISNPVATWAATDRAKQLHVAKEAGLKIPETLITNNPKDALDFHLAHDGATVVKALHNHSVDLNGKRYSMYTHRISKEDLSKLDDLIYAPCLFQQRLRKKSELRVTVVGDEVFAAQLYSGASRVVYEDLHLCSLADLSIRPLKLTDEFKHSCINIVSSLGLRYGAIDFVVDEKDERVFLEVNPTGDWYWIEQITKLPITRTMVDLIERMSN